MLLQPGHDLDEVAGCVSIVELVLEDEIPAVATGAGRTRDAKDVLALGDTGGRSGLNGRGADFGKRHVMKGDGETLDLFFKERTHGFDGDIEAGETRAA